MSDVLYVPNRPVYSQLRIEGSVHCIAVSGSEQCSIKAQSQIGQCPVSAHPEVVYSAQYGIYSIPVLQVQASERVTLSKVCTQQTVKPNLR